MQGLHATRVFALLPTQQQVHKVLTIKCYGIMSGFSSLVSCRKVQGYVDEHRASVLSSESANGDEGEAAKSPDQSYHIFEKKVTSRLQAHDQFSAPQPQSVDGSDTLHASCDDSHSSHSSSSYEDVENFHSYQNLPHPPSNTTSSLHQGNGMEPYLQNDKESQGLIPEYPHSYQKGTRHLSQPWSLALPCKTRHHLLYQRKVRWSPSIHLPLHMSHYNPAQKK